MTADLLSCIVAKLREAPEYAPLYEALTEPSPRLRLYQTPEGKICSYEICDSPLRSLCAWGALPDGAMLGPVWKALRAIELAVGKDTRRQEERIEVGLARNAVGAALWDANTNATVLATLADWLGVKEET